MKFRLSCLLPAVLAIALAPATHAATLWTGADTNFTQSATNLVDVLVPGAVSLTRGFSQWLYNPAGGDQGPAPGTPTDTEWAFGTLDNYAALGYETFDSYRNGDLSALLVGNPMVVHLVNEDIYLSLTFSQWPQNGGYFAYTRSTPAPPPSGTITSGAITSNQFVFEYAATPGSNYVVLDSSNLVNWLPVVTNLAATNSVLFTDSVTTNGSRYYRVMPLFQ